MQEPQKLSTGREHSVWLQKYRGQCLTHGKRGRKCSLALVTSSPVHNSQNKQLSSSANYYGRKSALASSVLIQPNKLCISLSRWDLFFLIYTYSMQLTHWKFFSSFDLNIFLDHLKYLFFYAGLKIITCTLTQNSQGLNLLIVNKLY